jgi:hypothetical protein
VYLPHRRWRAPLPQAQRNLNPADSASTRPGLTPKKQGAIRVQHCQAHWLSVFRIDQRRSTIFDMKCQMLTASPSVIGCGVLRIRPGRRRATRSPHQITSAASLAAEAIVETTDGFALELATEMIRASAVVLCADELEQARRQHPQRGRRIRRSGSPRSTPRRQRRAVSTASRAWGSGPSPVVAAASRMSADNLREDLDRNRTERRVRLTPLRNEKGPQMRAF